MKPQKVVEVRYLHPVTMIGEVHTFTSATQHHAELALTEVGVHVKWHSRAGARLNMIVPWTNVLSVKMELDDEVEQIPPKKSA